jgi:hypothetical protein
LARAVAARYLIAAFLFMDAALWLGISLSDSFICLFVFVLTCQGVHHHQRRSDSRRRRTSSRRERPSRYEAALAEDAILSSSPSSQPDRSRPSSPIYDRGREETGWPVASEASW